MNGFFCNVKFQQEGDDKEHSFYLNPGFTPLKVQKNIPEAIEEALFFVVYAAKAKVLS